MMAARDYQEEFWIQLNDAASKRGGLPNFGTPEDASALPSSAGEGVSWVFHFRAKHIRVGIVTYAENQNRYPNEAIKIAMQFVEEIEELTGRTVIIDESREGSPNGRLYVKIDGFIAKDKSTWSDTISDTLDCMGVFVEVLGQKISG